MSNLLSSPILTDGAFIIDNSRMENFQTCPRKAYFTILRRRITAGSKPALTFGSAIHLALCFRFRYYPLQPTPAQMADCTQRQYALLDAFFADVSNPDSEYRTADFAKETIRLYNETYSSESHSHIPTPIVEEPFLVELGEISGIPVLWSGRLDLGLMDHDGNKFPCDHKTTSIGGDYYFEQFYNSSQMIGYCFAMSKILGEPVTRVLIDALICRKPTRTGKGTELARHIISYDPEVITEWQTNTLHQVSDFFHCISRDFFPGCSTQCQTKFGKCDYFDACRMGPVARELYLNSDAFVNDEWSPLHKDKLDLESFFVKPLTDLSPKPPLGGSPLPKTNLNDILNNLGVKP